MLSGPNRLKKKKDFERVFKQGKGLKDDFLSLKFVKNDLATTRFGFVVGQKVSKKATARNKVKRRLRESAKNSLKRAKRGFDVVVIAGKGAEGKSFVEIKEVFDNLFKIGKLFND